MGDHSNHISTQGTADYLAQLLKDKKQLAAFPNVFLHAERLLDEEINKVRVGLFTINGTKRQPLDLPEANGPTVTLSEKVFVPVKEHPDFNFVGRILGPRGMTAKQLEQETGCKIMVRGKGSMRDKKKEDLNRGKANWEHLNEELHVLITVEDTQDRARLKLDRAVEEIKKLLVPAQADGEDELKKRQLMELAIINGTYRDNNSKTIISALSFRDGRSLTGDRILSRDSMVSMMYFPNDTRLVGPPMGLGTPLRSPTTPLGAPLILSPRMPMQPGAGILNGGPPPLIAPGDAGLLYSPYEYSYALASPLLAEYPGMEHTPMGAVAKQRRHMGIRDHPYTRAGSLS